MVAVWMFMLRKTVFASLMPAGRRRGGGNDSDVLRRMLSKERCRFQKAPLRSWSLSCSEGRCKWVRFRPNIVDMRITPPNDDRDEAPSPFKMSANWRVGSG